MENEKIKNYQFLNKVFIEGTPKQQKIMRIVRVLYAGLIVRAVLLLITDGLTFDNIAKITFPIMLLSLVTKNKGGGYQPIPAIIDIDNVGYRLEYTSIDRQDKKGNRKEAYSINYSNIQNVKYDSTEGSIKVLCKPYVEIDFQGNKDYL